MHRFFQSTLKTITIPSTIRISGSDCSGTFFIFKSNSFKKLSVRAFRKLYLSFSANNATYDIQSKRW